MEENVYVDEIALRNLAIVRTLEKLNLLIRLCRGFKNREVRINKLIHTLTSKNKSNFLKQKELGEFKRTLFGMNSFTDYPIIPKDKNPFIKHVLEDQIKTTADELWAVIEDCE